MRILILTDSLSLPRKHNTGEVFWEEIYTNLLRKEFPNIEFVHLGIGGATITDLLAQMNYYKNLKPDLIILQTGIVDCAPRAFGRIELELIKRLHVFRIVKYSFKFLRKYRRVTYTNINIFREALKKFKEIFQDTEFWAIGIVPGCSEYDKVVPGVSANIKLFNKTLKSEMKFIDLENIPRNGILEDFHHLNIKGHHYIYTLLKYELIKFLEMRNS